MKIYLDSDFRCHLADDGTMQAVETSVFDGREKAYIEGYRLVPGFHAGRGGGTGDGWTKAHLLKAYLKK